MDYSNAMINGIPLILVVLGLVEWAKRLGVQGKALPILSMLVGLVLGMLYQASLEMPTNWSGWFAAGVYGIGLGLVASGVYDALKGMVQKG